MGITKCNLGEGGGATNFSCLHMPLLDFGCSVN